jgi:hypothetical protein
MRRLIIVLGSLVLAGAVAVSIGMARNSPAFPPAASPVAASSAPSLSPQEQCTVQVMGLLNRSLLAVQEGYTGGLNIDQVAAQYGTDSATFKVFAATQTTLIGRTISRGASGQLTAIQDEVRQRCGELA